MGRIIRIVFLGFALLLWSNVRAQEPEQEEDYSHVTPDPPSRNFRIGVRTGISATTVGGSNFSNAVFTQGLTGGVTFRYKLGNISHDKPEAYRFGWETQFSFAYRGSRFANPNGQYNRISLFYLDLPFIWITRLDHDGKVKLLTGAQVSYLANSSMFIKPQVYSVDSVQPRIKPIDIAVVAGVEYKTEFVGVQVFLKPGLLNVNNGMNAANYPGLLPTLRGGSVKNFSLEFILSF